MTEKGTVSVYVEAEESLGWEVGVVFRQSLTFSHQYNLNPPVSSHFVYIDGFNLMKCVPAVCSFFAGGFCTLVSCGWVCSRAGKLERASSD